MDRFLVISTFAKVVELGSFSRTAERLGLSTSAVSRQVSELESHLNARLLNRTTRRLSLTEAGQSFYEHSVQVLADLDDAEASVRVDMAEPRGTLRLTCGVSFGTRYLAPALAEFSARHPDVLLDLDLSDRVVDLVEEGFDLAIRIGQIGSQGMVSKRLGWTQIVCCASPAYLARRSAPIREPADLAQHECLSYTNVAMPNAWHFEGRDGGESRVTVRVPPRHRANNGQVLASLAVQGLGIVYEPDFIVAQEIRTGQLVPLLPDHLPPRSPIAAVYPSRRHLSAKVRSFVEFLAERYERRHEWSLDDLPQ
ncbi:MAG: LysR family transcriptional regulator [Proteobacteria bacterium]|jgi:DNA-binding transcriptional LysR family regulator|nr:LysR family transcriptional regulator [Pseudomonadota bacterium]